METRNYRAEFPQEDDLDPEVAELVQQELGHDAVLAAQLDGASATPDIYAEYAADSEDEDLEELVEEGNEAEGNNEAQSDADSDEEEPGQSVEGPDLTPGKETRLPSSLDLFLRQSIKRYPNLLTPKEEIELAKQIERGNLDAKDRMIGSNVRLVVAVSRHYVNQGLTFDDLVQEGMLGLIRAAEKFDFRRGYRFSTYATIWIKQALQRGLDNSGRAIRLPSHVSQRLRKVQKKDRQLVVLLGRKPTWAELAEATELDEEEVVELMVRAEKQNPISLNLLVGDDGETELGELVPAAGSFTHDVHVDLARKTQQDALQGAFLAANLSYNERMVLTHRHGLFGETPKTLEKVGALLDNLSRERVRQIEQHAMSKLEASRPESLRDALYLGEEAA